MEQMVQNGTRSPAVLSGGSRQLVSVMRSPFRQTSGRSAFFFWQKPRASFSISSRVRRGREVGNYAATMAAHRRGCAAFCHGKIRRDPPLSGGITISCGDDARSACCRYVTVLTFQGSSADRTSKDCNKVQGSAEESFSSSQYGSRR